MANVYVIEEGTTNHIPRPLFSGGWHEANSLVTPPEGSGTVHLDTGTAPEGIPTTMRWELQTGPDAGTSGRFLLRDASVMGLSGGAWTESVWARTSSPDLVPVIYTDVRGVNGGITGTMVTPTDSLPTGVEAGEWFRIILTKDDWREEDQGAPSDATLYLGVYPTSAGRNQTGIVEFAGPQFEPKPYATSFAHGDMGEGYSWTGTPHASASIREPSSISMPSPEPESLYIRYSEDGEIWNNEYVSFEDKPEDTEPTLLLSPDGSYDRNGEVTPTLAGGVIEVNGEYGKAWQIAEATTNYVRNPRVNTSAYWGTLGDSSVTQSVLIDGYKEGFNAARVTCHGTNTSYQGHIINGESDGTQAVGTAWTASAKVRATEGAAIRILLREAGSGSYTQHSIVASGDWQDIEVTRAITDSGISYMQLRIDLAPGVVGVLDVAQPQIEKEDYPTPYCDGSLGAGHAWTGTPHESASTRIAAAAHVNNNQYLNSENGTVLIRIKDLGVANVLGQNRYLLGSGTHGTTDFISAVYSANTPKAWFRNGASPHQPFVSGNATVADGESAVFAMLWDNERIAASTNGLPLNESVRNGALTGIQSPVLNIGQSGFASQPSNAAIESALIFDTALSDAEIQRIVTMNEAWTWEEVTGFKVTSDLGQHAKIRYVDNNLKLLTDKKLYIGTVIGFSRPLSQKEVEILDSTPLEYISGKTLLNLPETTVGVSQLL